MIAIESRLEYEYGSLLPLVVAVVVVVVVVLEVAGQVSLMALVVLVLVVPYRVASCEGSWFVAAMVARPPSW